MALGKAREKPSPLLSTVAANIADQSMLMEYAQEAAPEARRCLGDLVRWGGNLK